MSRYVCVFRLALFSVRYKRIVDIWSDDLPKVSTPTLH